MTYKARDRRLVKPFGALAGLSLLALVLVGEPATAHAAPKYYYIKNHATGKCLDIPYGSRDNGANVQQWQCHAVAQELFYFISVESEFGPYQIRSAATGKCIDVTAYSNENGANIQQWTCSGRTNQLFRLDYVDDGSRFRIVNVKSGKCLDVPYGSPANGANVQQWACSENAQQKWTLSQTP